MSALKKVRGAGGLVAAAALQAALMTSALAQTADAPVNTAPSAAAVEAPVGETAVAPVAPAVPVQTDASAEAARERWLADACIRAPARLSPEEVDAFIAAPGELLTNYGSQNLALSNRVRALAGSSGRTLDPILALASGASEEQKAAIGSGLGRTAYMCQGINADYAGEIQSRIADLNAPGLVTAFLSASNDMQVASIGGAGGAGAVGGGGGGAPGLSGGGTAGPGTAGAAGDNTTPNTSTVYSSRGGSGVVVDDNGTGSGGVTFNLFGSPSVSPTVPN